MKGKKGTILKISVSLILFGVLLWRVDMAEIWQTIKLLNLIYVPVILLLLVLNYVVGAFRWKKFLIFTDSEHVTVKYLINLYFVGSYFNNFMPTSVGGDAIKFFKLGQKINSKANAFAATFMERFTGVMALVLISYYGLIKTLDFWIAQLPEFISGNALYLTLFKLFLFVGFWIGVLVAFYMLKILSSKNPTLKKIYDAISQYKNRADILLYALLTSFLVQLFAIFTQYFVFRAIGITIPLDFALFVFPVITLAGFFIPSLNGLGVQDALYSEFFAMVGVPHEVSISASIVYHLSRLVISLIGGVLYALGKAD